MALCKYTISIRFSRKNTDYMTKKDANAKVNVKKQQMDILQYRYFPVLFKGLIPSPTLKENISISFYDVINEKIRLIIFVFPYCYSYSEIDFESIICEIDTHSKHFK